MYLRPGNLFKDFTVHKKEASISTRGRAKREYGGPAGMFRAVLAAAKPEEKERWRQLQHPISHTIVQKGVPLAGVGDCLAHGGRLFYVQGVDEVGALGLWTIYMVEERLDGHEH